MGTSLQVVNKIEKTIESILTQLHFFKEKQCGFFEKQFKFHNFVLDFADPVNKMAIEVQGTYWHGHPLSGKLNKTQRIKRLKDRMKRRKLEQSGWSIIYVWEHSINRNLEKVKRHLEKEILNGIEI